MPEVKQDLKNVYYDTAASPYLYDPRIYIYMKELAGSDKILFGSDFPLLPPSRLIKQIDDLSLDTDYYDNIMYQNAHKLFNI